MPSEESIQHELPLPFPELTGDQPLLPARMVNEYGLLSALSLLGMGSGRVGGFIRYGGGSLPTSPRGFAGR